ncbi:MAG: flagellar basal-body rod protein FlgF [Sphingomonadales bacterium]
MDNTIYVGLSHQMALRRRLDVIANNIANMNTTAFKNEDVMFQQYLAEATETSGATGEPVSMVYDVGTSRDMAEGEIAPTGNPLDVAIQGDGYFTVLGADGVERYTRNGHFQLNADGVLVTSSGESVLGVTGNEIELDPADTSLSIASDGTITTSTGIAGQLNVVQFDENQRPLKVGNSLYESDFVPTPAENIRVEQGMLESSNVVPVMQITKMIELLRSYQSTGRLLSDYQDLQRRAVRTLGQFG